MKRIWVINSINPETMIYCLFYISKLTSKGLLTTAYILPSGLMFTHLSGLIMLINLHSISWAFKKNMLRRLQALLFPGQSFSIIWNMYLNNILSKLFNVEFVLFLKTTFYIIYIITPCWIKISDCLRQPIKWHYNLNFTFLIVERQTFFQLRATMIA